MSFDRKNLQDDDEFNFDDDDFKFEDEPARSTGEFQFDDEPDDVRIGADDSPGTFGFEDEDMPDLAGDEPQERQGASRTFIFLAAAMILLFLLGLAAVLFLVLRNQGPTPIELTSTSIALTNAQVEILANQTQTQVAEIAFANTQTALAPTATPSPSPTNTIVPTSTPTPAPPTLDPTAAFANALLTQSALDATQTAQALLVTPTVAQPSVSDVALTATQLAILLGSGGGIATLPPGTQVALGGPTPTPEGFGAARPTAVPSELPDTGFFDDLLAGNPGLLALLVVGLLGVIILSRVMRSANNRS